MLYLSIVFIDVFSGRLDVIVRGKFCGQGVMLNRFAKEREKKGGKRRKKEEKVVYERFLVSCFLSILSDIIA